MGTGDALGDDVVDEVRDDDAGDRGDGGVCERGDDDDSVIDSTDEDLPLPKAAR